MHAQDFFNPDTKWFGSHFTNFDVEVAKFRDENFLSMSK